MTGFNQRTIANHETLGQRLQRIRAERQLSVIQVASALQIRQDYIDAIEASNYKALPSGVFVRHYVRNYAKFLRISVDEIMVLLEDELRVYNETPGIPTLKQHLSKKPLHVAQVVIVVGILFLLLGIGLYFTYEISNAVQPPVLTLQSLPTMVTADQRVVTIAGQTAPEAIVSINDQPIAVQADGQFSQPMTLQNGSNVFKIVAKTKRSKSNTQYIEIYLK